MQTDQPQMQKDEYDGLSWMTEDTKNHLHYLDKIVKEKNIDALFMLTDNSDFSIVLQEILDNQCGYNPDSLNHTQRVLFLCIHLENAGQADHILGFLQEDHPKYATDVIDALQEIGATKSAGIIKQAVELLPKNGEWFFENADEDSKIRMGRCDYEFSSYPDGFLRDLYRKYAEKHKADFYKSE